MAVRGRESKAGDASSSAASHASAAGVPPPAVFERNDGQAPAEFRCLARQIEHEFTFTPDAVAIAVSDPGGSTIVNLRFADGVSHEPSPELRPSGRVRSLRALRGWGWHDEGWGAVVRSPAVYFTSNDDQHRPDPDA